jgi:ribosomal protein S18 acetylase RimI-like enzyme
MEGSLKAPKLRIRPARPADIAEIFAMKRALTADEGNEAVLRASEQDWLRDGFGRAPRFCCIVAEAETTLIGMATYNEIYLTALGGPIFTIQDLYVAPGRRKLGAGRALVAEIAAVALERGIPLIELAVREDNAARKFYRRLGFRHLKECLTYAIGGEPMLALTLPAGSGVAPSPRRRA